MSLALDLPKGLCTPVPVVDLPRLKGNIETMAAAMETRGVALWPHFKTPKTIEVARLQLAAGAAGITCATLAEAEALASAGVQDIFIAYPLWADGREHRIRHLASEVRLRVGTDCVEAVSRLAAAVNGTSGRPAVMIEVDSGDGRSGVPPVDAGKLARAIAAAGLELAGAFTHGGHGYDPGRAAEAGADEVRALDQARRAITEAGLECPALSAGSTPTVLLSARPPINEERPGTYVFGDRQQLVIGSMEAGDIALWVAATVVSTSIPGRFTIDAGAKTLGRDRPEWLEGHGEIPAYPSARVARVYDHHAVCEMSEDGPKPRMGEILAVIPNHVCSVVNLAQSLVVASGGEVVGDWAVMARGVF